MSIKIKSTMKDKITDIRSCLKWVIKNAEYVVARGKMLVSQNMVHVGGQSSIYVVHVNMKLKGRYKQ